MAVRGRELRGVCQEIPHDLLEPRRIAVQRGPDINHSFDADGLVVEGGADRIQR
jgi:hypothetical protein